MGLINSGFKGQDGRKDILKSGILIDMATGGRFDCFWLSSVNI